VIEKLKAARGSSLVVAGAVLLALSVPASGGTRVAEPRLEGPFGTGAGGVWLLRPAGQPKSVVVFGHGWKRFPPSPARPWVGQFGPWLEHLVRGGSAVLFPRYQTGVGDPSGRATLKAYRRGLDMGFRRLRTPGVPVITAGYSYGASLAFAYAADARRWRLPQPRALDCIFPAMPIVEAKLAPIPRSVHVLIQVGADDVDAGRAGGEALWLLLTAHPAAGKRYQLVSSRPGFIADHAAPKRSDVAARRAFWLPLDTLIAFARTA
jgi:pimeloyl-ACP methyl ester carboxylesterase